MVYSCEIEGNNLVWNTVENFDDENDFGEFIIEPITNENKGGNSNLFEKGNQIDTASKIINEFDTKINTEELDKKRSSDININIPKLENLPEKDKKFFDERKSTENQLLLINKSEYLTLPISNMTEKVL